MSSATVLYPMKSVSPLKSDNLHLPITVDTRDMNLAKDVTVMRPPVKRNHDWIQDALTCLPLEQLPVFLLPRLSLKQRIQPPRLHFGWPFLERYILEIGKLKGFVTKGIIRSPKYREYVSLAPTEKRIQEITLHELGVPSSSCVPRVLSAFGPLSDYFLALSNNYLKGDYTPPKEDIEKIREYFGLEGPPMWYLDAEGYQYWGYHTLDKRKHS